MDTLTIKRLTWIRALESGEYPSTTGALFRKGGECVVGYCCIGVARDVIDPKYFDTEAKLDIDYTDRGTIMVNGEDDYQIVREELEMSQAITDYLIGMNDGMSVYRQEPGNYDDARMPGNKRDFKFIARYLRKVWGLTGV